LSKLLHKPTLTSPGIPLMQNSFAGSMIKCLFRAANSLAGGNHIPSFKSLSG
jgi:hypothetical protein